MDEIVLEKRNVTYNYEKIIQSNPVEAMQYNKLYVVQKNLLN